MAEARKGTEFGLQVRLFFEMRIIRHIFILLSLLATCCCTGQTLKTYGYKVEEVLPHDVTSYTQGLFFHEGQLYESAGQYGESSMRKVELSSGKVTERVNFDRNYFVEGSCILDGRLFILTWREHECLVYDPVTMTKLGSFRYQGEGWGLTTDGKYLIMSDGTSTIRFLDPSTFVEKKSVTVTKKGQKVLYLNELEYIDGDLWANIYGTDMIAIINPDDGVVKALVNCSGLLPSNLRKSWTDVLNGIAYDETTGSIYLTGKYWPRMYRIKLVKKN